MQWHASVFKFYLNARKSCTGAVLARSAAEGGLHSGAYAGQHERPTNHLAGLLCCPQADDTDVERLKKERASQGPAVAAEPLPERFYKLPRIRFLLLLCKELARINRHISKVGTVLAMVFWLKAQRLD
jgi:hypothetical protein